MCEFKSCTYIDTVTEYRYIVINTHTSLLVIQVLVKVELKKR